MNYAILQTEADRNRITSAVGSRLGGIGRSSLFAVSVLLFLAAVAGCGKKAMPSPQGAQPVPVVSDLSYEVDGTDVLLEWTVPDELVEGESIVSRAGTKLGDDMCEDCPPAFGQVAALPIHSQGVASKQIYRDSPAPGFRYTYRIVMKTDDGRTSGASNLVTFDYGPE